MLRNPPKAVSPWSGAATLEDNTPADATGRLGLRTMQESSIAPCQNTALLQINHLLF